MSPRKLRIFAGPLFVMLQFAAVALAWLSIAPVYF
jgi:hypothetical protein